MSTKNAARTDKGTFPQGVSGNPAGRPKGSKNQITLLKQSLELQLREQAAPNLGAVLEKAVELALEGDRQMIKLLLDKHLTSSSNDEAKAADKVAIQINAVPRPEEKVVEIIDSTPTEEV